jgi:hypothetical protein
MATTTKISKKEMQQDEFIEASSISASGSRSTEEGRSFGSVAVAPRHP